MQLFPSSQLPRHRRARCRQASAAALRLLMSALSASLQGLKGIIGAIALSAVLFAVYIACTKVFKVDWKSLKALAE